MEPLPYPLIGHQYHNESGYSTLTEPNANENNIEDNFLCSAKDCDNKSTRDEDTVKLNTIQNIYKSPETNAITLSSKFDGKLRHTYDAACVTINSTENANFNSTESDNERVRKSIQGLRNAFINSSPPVDRYRLSLQEPSAINTTAKVDEGRLLKTTSHIEELQRSLSTKLTPDTVEKLKLKYSPAGFGSCKRDSPLQISPAINPSRESSKIPVPTPRHLNSKPVEVKQPQDKVSKPIDQNSQLHANPNEIASGAAILNENFTDPQECDSETEVVLRNPQKREGSLTEAPLVYGDIEFAEPEEKHFIAKRSSSEDSVDKVESFFTELVMDKPPKLKKRSNSFRKILSGGFFGKEKKKPDEDKSKNKKKDNRASDDNAHNEIHVFDKNSRHCQKNCNQTFYSNIPTRNTNPQNGTKRHPQSQLPMPRNTPNSSYTVMGAIKDNGRPPVPLPTNADYVMMTNQSIKQFHDSRNHYINMPSVNKYIDTTSSSSNTIDSENRNCTYQNALIAQAELRRLHEGTVANSVTQVRKYSSGREHFLAKRREHFDGPNSCGLNQESYESVQLVKPKALIPINSERPLPNPYRNSDRSNMESSAYQGVPQYSSKGAVEESSTNSEDEEVSSGHTLDRNLNKGYSSKDTVDSKTLQPSLDEIYGTVFDSLSVPRANLYNKPPKRYETAYNRSLSPSLSNRSDDAPSSPTPQKCQLSPRSLEASKLKLPPNREKIDLQPRIKSPIPQIKVSTEKLIATELLRKHSPLPSPRSTSSYGSHEEGKHLQNSSLKRREKPLSPKTVHRQSPMGQNTLSELDDFPIKEERNTVLSTKEETSRASPVTVDTIPERFQKELQISTSPSLKEMKQEGSPRRQATSTLMSPSGRSGTPIHLLQKGPLQPVQLQGRPTTPLNQNICHSPIHKSPQKQHMFENVEAFYWRELKRLKEKEELELLRYRQMQLQMYGYVEDPVTIRRSRSMSPSVQRGGRRSLSLPRDVKPTSGPLYVNPKARIPQSIPEEYPPNPSVIQITYPTPRFNSTFVRNTGGRSTIGPIDSSRGPLRVQQLTLSQSKKAVSFSNPQNFATQQVWPTKNGFTHSPPTRVDRDGSLEDDVFYPNSPRGNIQPGIQKESPYGSKPIQRNVYGPQPVPLRHFTNIPRIGDDPYGKTQNGRLAEDPYVSRRTIENIQGRVQQPTYDSYGRIQNSRVIGESPYGSKKAVEDPRRVQNLISFEESPYGPRKPPDGISGNVQNCGIPPQPRAPLEDPYGRAVYGTKLQNGSPAVVERAEESPYGSRRIQYVTAGQIYDSKRRQQEDPYGKSLQKQVTVSNKVCDIYGQIHDQPQQRPGVPPPYRDVKGSGVMFGQLQRNPNSPLPSRPAYTTQTNAPGAQFVRGTRLTASVNDMYKRYPANESRLPYRVQVRYQDERGLVVSNRPLPPVPCSDSQNVPMRKLIAYGRVPVSDTESGSEGGEVQRIMQNQFRSNRK